MAAIAGTLFFGAPAAGAQIDAPPAPPAAMVTGGAAKIDPAAVSALAPETIAELREDSPALSPHKHWIAESGRWVDLARIHFDNHLTCYLFETGGVPHLEIKGLSGGRIRGHSSEVDHVERFDGPAASARLASRLHELASLEAKTFADPGRRDFSSHDRVTLVMSAATRAALGPEADRYLTHLREVEQRHGSTLIEIPDAIAKARDPSKVRSFLKTQGVVTEGILLIGADLQPFEIYARSGPTTARGTTDLPFGDLESPFWDHGRAKSAPDLAGSVYFADPTNTFSTEKPTRVAFDMDALAAGAHRQEHWVARWIPSGATDDDAAAEFRAFVDRRIAYRPPERHNLVGARGGEGVLYDPGDDPGIWRTSEETYEPFAASDSQLLIEADTRSLLRGLDRNTTFLNLMEHGAPSGFGNVNASDLDRVEWLPEVVQLDSCSSGAWAYAGSLGSSVLAKALNVREPPVAISAFQAVKSMPTIGAGDSVVPEEQVFFSRWKTGQTLGARQKECLDAALARADLTGQDRLQHFAGLSIFGAGEAEK